LRQMVERICGAFALVHNGSHRYSAIMWRRCMDAPKMKHR